MSENAQFPLTPGDLMKRVATKGDLATVLLAAPIGFVGDIVLSLSSIVSPGVCAVLTASGALGLKNAAQAMFARNRNGAASKAISNDYHLPLQRAERLLSRVHYDLAKESGPDLSALSSIESILKQEIGLFIDGVTDSDTLETATGESLKRYRLAVGLDNDALATPRIGRIRV